MKTAILLGVLMTAAAVGATEARAANVGSSHIQWKWSMPTVDLHDPWAVNAQLTANYATPYVQYFTPAWYPGNAPNIYTGVADQGFLQTYSIMHDWNTHNSPFGGFWGYVDIITPLLQITHKQIADFFSLGVTQVPSNLPFPSHVTDPFLNSYSATGWGSYPAPFNNTDDGYRDAAALAVPLPPGTTSPTECGKLKVHEALRGSTGISSCNYTHHLTLDANGRLSFWKKYPVYFGSSHFWMTEVLWSTPEVGAADYALIVQPDGDIVLYRPNWTRVLAAGTRGQPGAYVHLTDDGHLDIRTNQTILNRIY